MSDRNVDAPKEKYNAEEEAYQRIKKAIRSKQILPKRKLVESTLAEILGMSRTPVRAAIKRLEYEGYVKSVPRKGAYLVSPTIKDIKDTFDVRVLLERKTIELAIENLTEERIETLSQCIQNESSAYLQEDYMGYDLINEQFHLSIARFSENNILCKHTEEILNTCNIFQLIYDTDSSDVSLPASIATHQHLLDLMKKKDKTAAADLMEEHIYTAMNRMRLDTIETQKFNDFLSI